MTDCTATDLNYANINLYPISEAQALALRNPLRITDRSIGLLQSAHDVLLTERSQFPYRSPQFHFLSISLNAVQLALASIIRLGTQNTWEIAERIDMCRQSLSIAVEEANCSPVAAVDLAIKRALGAKAGAL